MNLSCISAHCSADEFLRANLNALDVGEMTCRDVLAAPAEGALLRRRDSIPFVAWNEQALGLPLPRTELQRVIADTNDSTLLVVFGLGTGHLPRALRRISQAPIIVYEPRVGVLRTVLESGPVELDGVHLVSNLHDLSTAWGRYSGRRRDSVVVNTPGYSAAFPKECELIPPAIQRLVERVTITKNTYR